MVLVLVVWFRLPVSNAVCTQDLLDLIADFNLSMVTDQFGWVSPFLNLIFQHVEELPVGIHRVYICYQGLSTNKDLCNGGT